MSYADLLRKFAEHPVTPVTPSNDPEVTEKPTTNQRSNLSYLGNPERPKKTKPEQKPRSAEALLHDIAQLLEANPRILRSLLSDDDMQDIAEEIISRSHLISYFRLMRSDGVRLKVDEPTVQVVLENRSGRVQSMQAWKPAHDALIDHLMSCEDCYAPSNRYCKIGTDLRGAYRRAC